MGNDVPTFYDMHYKRIHQLIDTEIGCIELLTYSGFLEETKKCEKCRKVMTIRFTSKYDGGYAY